MTSEVRGDAEARRSVRQFVTTHRVPDDAVLPPGPKWPAAMQTVMFLTLRSRFLPRWRRKYGDVFSVNIAPAGRGVVISRPEYIREIFAGPADTFHAGEGNAILGPIMGEHSVLLLDEQEHLAARRRVMAAFHGETTSGYAEVIEELTARTVEQWPVGEAFALHPLMNDISLEVILRIVFGVRDVQRLEQMRPLIRELVNVGPLVFVGWLYPRLSAVGPWRRFHEVQQAADALIYEEIAQRRTADDLAARTDVLSKLLVAAPEQSNTELRDHLVTLLLAGHETTASTLAWTFHDLARRPDLQRRVQRAADERDDDYLEAVVKESLRLRPVISNVARRLAKPARVAGYDLPAGVVVFPSIMLVQRSPELYPSPEDFRPERFLNGAPPPGTWIPFGGGIRRCLGAALATVEAKAVITAVLQRVTVEADGPPERVRIRNITVVPARGARVRITRRLSNRPLIKPAADQTDAA